MFKRLTDYTSLLRMLSVVSDSKAVRLVVPLASYHVQVGATDGAEVSDVVVTAVDVGKSLVKRYVKHCQLVVVANQTLQEGQIAEGQACQVVVRAIDVLQVGAVVKSEACQVVVGANHVDKGVTVAECELLHAVVAADECAEREQTGYD